MVENYLCSSYLRYKKPNQPAPANVQKADRFNQSIQTDVFWIRTDKKKCPIMAILDSATKYQVACQVQTEQTQDYITSLERQWIAHFGVPEELVTDEGRGWLSNEFMEWSGNHSINHKVAPDEAHERLDQIERRHAILRKAIEVYVHDLKLEGKDGIRQALTYILPQLNVQPTVAGFSPTQWVLGYQPAQPGLLQSSSCALHEHETGEKNLHQRNVAKTAILSIYLSISYLSIYLFSYLVNYLAVYLPIYLIIYLSIYLSIYQTIYLFSYLSVYLPMYLSVYLSVPTGITGIANVWSNLDHFSKNIEKRSISRRKVRLPPPKLKLRIYLAGFLAMFTRAHTTPSAPPVRADFRTCLDGSRTNWWTLQNKT